MHYEKPAPDLGADPGIHSFTAARILLGDDDRVIRCLCCKALTREGYDVDVVEDGGAAWEAICTTSYELLITDNKMPGLDGFELLSRMRSAGMKVPVILASGTVAADEIQQHQGLDFAATLLKPFTTDQLLRVVREVLHTANHKNAPPSASVFTESLNHIDPYCRWGLNE